MAFDIRKWKQLNESSFDSKRMTEAEKKATLEAVSKFNEYGQHIYKTKQIAEMVENIKSLSENASKMVMQEENDWFDAVSVKRDTKAIGEAVKVFEATAKEAQTLQQRFESVFEDIGQKLGKYYEIKELQESEAQDAYQDKFQDAMDDEGIDSPAELDDDEKKAFFNKVDKSHKAKSEGKFTNKYQKQVNEAFEGVGGVISIGAIGSPLMSNSKRIKEAAPKMKKEKYDKELEDAAHSLVRFDNIIKMENPGAHGRAKSKLKNAHRAVNDLRHLR